MVTGQHTSGERTFDPARVGFGFRNPVEEVAVVNRVGPLLRRLDAILYGKGLCFGMVAMALRSFAEQPMEAPQRPLAGLPPSPKLLGEIRRYHVRQYLPRVVLASVVEWLRSLGGRPDGTLGRLRLAGPNPHLICFGPALNRRFLWCLLTAHAVAPYRIEAADRATRVYVYDPNHPGDRGRYVLFRLDGSGRIGSSSTRASGRAGGGEYRYFPSLQ